MVWDGSANGGFTTGTPWLPVKAPQLARNVASQTGVAGSVLETYRAMLAFRRGTPALMSGASRFFDLPEPILGFVRGDAVACVFNLSPEVRSVRLTGARGIIGVSQDAVLGGDQLALGPNGFAFLEVGPEVTIA